jgi:hypothetical protein
MNAPLYFDEKKVQSFLVGTSDVGKERRVMRTYYGTVKNAKKMTLCESSRVLNQNSYMDST